MSRFGMLNINGTSYDLDDLTIDEVEAIEDAAGGTPFSEINYGSAKGMKAFALVLLRRTNPDVTVEEVGRIKVVSILPADEEMPALPPDGTEESQSELELDGSGAPPSVVSIAG